MTRTKLLRSRLAWSQTQMAAYLRLAQPAVHRLEAGQRESGPVSRVLDGLELEVYQQVAAHPELSGEEIGRRLLQSPVDIAPAPSADRVLVAAALTGQTLTSEE